LRKYISDEAITKKRTNLNLSQWKDSYPADIPTQHNRHDCGMFMLLYMDRLARGAPLDFSQKDIPLFRQRLILTLLHPE